MKWTLVMLGVLAVLALAVAELDGEDEDSFQAWDDAFENSDVDDNDDDSDSLVRVVRAARAGGRANARKANKNACRYTKGPWTECDTVTNQRSRTLTLKKGESTCEATKTIAKRCKKVCRYARGSWTGCAHFQQIRTDLLLPDSDVDCQATRQIIRRCQDPSTALTQRNSSTEDESTSSRRRKRPDPEEQNGDSEEVIDLEDNGDESEAKNDPKTTSGTTMQHEKTSLIVQDQTSPQKEKESLTKPNDSSIPQHS